MKINQKDNFDYNFGYVFRSSAIFYGVNNTKVKTTISFANYWYFKNNIVAQVLINLREMSGKLVSRRIENFDTSGVCNFTPPDGFEGSIEVEAFGNRDMRIPYAAVMAIYECQDSITMVHSYARTYSQHEIEEDRTITEGAESCWTIREDDATTSFCVIHNGPSICPSQEIELGIRNKSGELLFGKFHIDQLRPYETLIIKPKEIIPGIDAWLMGEPGSGQLNFQLNGAFTRMLCATTKNNGKQLQVTHSNFNYHSHETDYIEGENKIGYMKTPATQDKFKQEIVIYPDCAEGEFTISGLNTFQNFSNGKSVVIDSGNHGSNTFQFRSKDRLPSRIVTGLRLKAGSGLMPAECSLGIIHDDEPDKHFHWMIVSQSFSTLIYWVAYEELFGKLPIDTEIVFNLYVEYQKTPLTKNIKLNALSDNGSMKLDEIFEGLKMHESYSYLTVWTPYIGMVFFTSLEKGGSITIEHSF